MNEEFRAIEGYPKYQVSERGNVRSICSGQWKVLRPSFNYGGYPCVGLANGSGKSKSSRVHRLVAQAFIPNPGNLPCVRHLDGSRTNDNSYNLAWGTHGDNEQDKKGHGTWDASRVGNRSLSTEHLAEAKRLTAEGMTQKDIGLQIGVHERTIQRALAGITYKAYRKVKAPSMAERLSELSKQLYDALDRITTNSKSIFDKVPVRDWEEALAEADAALNAYEDQLPGPYKLPAITAERGSK